jgi:hypothetical protein
MAVGGQVFSFDPGFKCGRQVLRFQEERLTQYRRSTIRRKSHRFGCQRFRDISINRCIQQEEGSPAQVCQFKSRRQKGGGGDWAVSDAQCSCNGLRRNAEQQVEIFLPGFGLVDPKPIEACVIELSSALPRVIIGAQVAQVLDDDGSERHLDCAAKLDYGR